MSLKLILCTTANMNCQNARLILLVSCLHFICIILSVGVKEKKSNTWIGILGFPWSKCGYASILISCHWDMYQIVVFSLMYCVGVISLYIFLSYSTLKLLRTCILIYPSFDPGVSFSAWYVLVSAYIFILLNILLWLKKYF